MSLGDLINKRIQIEKSLRSQLQVPIHAPFWHDTSHDQSDLRVEYHLRVWRPTAYLLEKHINHFRPHYVHQFRLTIATNHRRQYGFSTNVIKKLYRLTVPWVMTFTEFCVYDGEAGAFLKLYGIENIDRWLSNFSIES